MKQIRRPNSSLFGLRFPDSLRLAESICPIHGPMHQKSVLQILFHLPEEFPSLRTINLFSPHCGPDRIPKFMPVQRR